MTDHRIVIAGGGLAAIRTAQTLRNRGHAGEIRIFSAETEPPYDRPPLSKRYLLGEQPDETIRLLSTEAYAKQGLNLELDREVVALDPATRTVTLADDSTVTYDQFVIATGARARSLSVFEGSETAYNLRTASDSRRLATALRTKGRIAVVGGGFIGLEVAATARTCGNAVTVIEAEPAPLSNVVGAEIARWLQSRHEKEGVEFRCHTTVTAVEAANGGAERLRLSDGSALEVDTVIVGVGVTRDVAWLARAGLDVADGLLCDAAGRTNVPDVFGVGDIVCHRTDRGLLPIAHWTATVNSAGRTAHAMLGLEPPSQPEDGFFWSDQYDLGLQFAGRVDPCSEVAVVAGDLGSDSFVAQFRTDGSMTGVFASNSRREFLQQRKELRKSGINLLEEAPQ